MSVLFIEEEHGSYTGIPHPHNGYYAGDFSVPDSGWLLGPVTVCPTSTSAT